MALPPVGTAPAGFAYAPGEWKPDWRSAGILPYDALLRALSGLCPQCGAQAVETVDMNGVTTGWRICERDLHSLGVRICEFRVRYGAVTVYRRPV